MQSICKWGVHIWRPQNFRIFWPPPPCHCNKSADFVPFDCFLGTPSPTHCRRHIWKPPNRNGCILKVLAKLWTGNDKENHPSTDIVYSRNHIFGVDFRSFPVVFRSVRYGAVCHWQRDRTRGREQRLPNSLIDIVANILTPKFMVF